MKFADNWTAEQAQLIDLLVQTWNQTWSWPTFAYVADVLDEQGIDAAMVLQSFPVLGGSAPGRSSYADVFFDHTRPSPPEDSIVALSVTGLARHHLGEDTALTFIAVLKTAAEQYQQTPRDPSSVGEFTFTSKDAMRAIPGASREIVAAVGHLLSQEPVRGRRVWNGNSATGGWSITFTRRVSSYRDVTIDRYVELVTADIGVTELVEPIAADESFTVSSMTSGGPSKVFISHAAADAKLGALLRETLVLGGVPGERIFYSSKRSTGIPTGTDVRSRLRQELNDAGLVVELLTPTFFTRPMCLMELGGAWALDKPTYPIVVPPMELKQATDTLGQINMGQLTTDSHIDDVFDEMSDRLKESLQLMMPTAAWNDSVRSFKQKLPGVLAEGPVQNVPSLQPVSQESAAQPQSADAVAISNVASMEAYGGGAKVVGRATNSTSRQLTVLLKAVFLERGSIVDTADGVVPELSAGASKAFEIQTFGPVAAFDSVQIQIEQLL